MINQFIKRLLVKICEQLEQQLDTRSTKLTGRRPLWWRLWKPKSTSVQTQTFFVVVGLGVFPNLLFHTSSWGIIRLCSHVCGTPNGSSGLFAVEPLLAQQRAESDVRTSYRKMTAVFMFTLLIYGICRVETLSFSSPYCRGECCRKTNWRHSCKHFLALGPTAEACWRSR